MSSLGEAGSERIKLQSGLDRLELEVSPERVDQLLEYMHLLREWSGAYNLVAAGERPFLLARHVLDSLSIHKFLQKGSLLDVGTGAGLPGMPLAIVRPDMKASLLDSAGKKIRFLRHVARSLKLENIHPLHQRVESLDQTYSNVTSRAFATIRGFVSAARSCADDSTRMLAMKAAYPHKELEDLPGWVNVESVEELNVPYLHAERHLVIMTVT